MATVKCTNALDQGNQTRYKILYPFPNKSTSLDLSSQIKSIYIYKPNKHIMKIYFMVHLMILIWCHKYLCFASVLMKCPALLCAQRGWTLKNHQCDKYIEVKPSSKDFHLEINITDPKWTATQANSTMQSKDTKHILTMTLDITAYKADKFLDN
jgi:hypothetical protein